VLIRVRQDTAEVGGRAHSIGVVIAQHPAHAGKGVLAELVRRLVLPPLLQDVGEAVGREQRVRVSSPSTRRWRVRVSSAS
jgi:hypothetical protein